MTPQQIIEIKRHIFPRYIGSKFVHNICADDAPGMLLTGINGDSILSTRDGDYYIDFYKLSLRSLESITEEEKKIIIQLEYGEWSRILEDEIKTADNIIKDGSFNAHTHQYLQLKGYALPQLIILDGKPVTLSVEEQVKYGIIKIKE